MPKNIPNSKKAANRIRGRKNFSPANVRKKFDGSVFMSAILAMETILVHIVYGIGTTVSTTGIGLPDRCNACSTIIVVPPQHGTTIRRISIDRTS